MATTPREWPNNAMNVRDGVAEIIRSTKKELERISTNEVNDEEGIEAIVAKANSDLTLLLRALEAVGANTNPVVELDNRVNQIKGILTFA